MTLETGGGVGFVAAGTVEDDDVVSRAFDDLGQLNDVVGGVIRFFRLRIGLLPTFHSFPPFSVVDGNRLFRACSG